MEQSTENSTIHLVWILIWTNPTIERHFLDNKGNFNIVTFIGYDNSIVVNVKKCSFSELHSGGVKWCLGFAL